MRENRGFVRLSIDARAKIKIKGSKCPAQMISVQDISGSGVRAISSMPVDENAHLELTLNIPGIGDLRADGKVVWKRMISDTLFDLGIEFTAIEPAEKEKITNLIENKTGRVIERREFVRCDLKATFIYKLIEGPDLKKEAVSINVSASGLKALMKERLEKGTKLYIAFKLPQDEKEIIAKCTVVAWVKKGDQDLFETGIEFLEISDEDRKKISKYVKKTLGVNY